MSKNAYINVRVKEKTKQEVEDINNNIKELAEAINLTGGNPYPKKFNKIINLYAHGNT